MTVSPLGRTTPQPPDPPMPDLLLDVRDLRGGLAEDSTGVVSAPAPIGVNPVAAEPFVPKPDVLDQASAKRRSLIAPFDDSWSVVATVSFPMISVIGDEVSHERSSSDDADTLVTQLWPNGTAALATRDVPPMRMWL